MTETTTETNAPPVEENRPTRYLTNQGGDVHILEQVQPGVAESEDAGVPGGLTDAARAVEAARVEAAPQTEGMVADYTYNPIFDALLHEMPVDGLHPMEVPRHDRYAAENTGDVPWRVVPYTASNANPSYAEGESGIGAVDPRTVAETEPQAPDAAPEHPGIEDGVTVVDAPPPAEPAAAPPAEPGPADIPPPPAESTPTETVPDSGPATEAPAESAAEPSPGG